MQTQGYLQRRAGDRQLSLTEAWLVHIAWIGSQLRGVCTFLVVCWLEVGVRWGGWSRLLAWNMQVLYSLGPIADLENMKQRYGVANTAELEHHTNPLMKRCEASRFLQPVASPAPVSLRLYTRSLWSKPISRRYESTQLSAAWYSLSFQILWYRGVESLRKAFGWSSSFQNHLWFMCDVPIRSSHRSSRAFDMV